MDAFIHLFLILLGIPALMSAWFAITSFLEKEQRAALVAALCFFILLMAGTLWASIPFSGKSTISMILDGSILLVMVLLLIPWKHKKNYPKQRSERIDERDTQFSRYYSFDQQTEAYYHEHPENRDIDAAIKRLPGLLDINSRQYHPFYFAAADASARIIESLRDENRGTPATGIPKPDLDQLQGFIKEWSKDLGALDSGVCLLKPHHLYTIRGRNQYYGKPAENHHTHALAFMVEMNRDHVATAPKAPVIMESCQQYLNVGLIALRVAGFLRSMGWEATAHIDANYEVICPLVARDAGLGEIGRMGILMSHQTGPRCRISVVTTTAPFKPATVKQDANVLYFCEQCKKCVHCCPSRAIPESPFQTSPEEAGWKIDHEKCFSLWCREGTDCARCMAVCPFSHGNTLLHRVIRKWITHSKPFAWLAVHLDDLFYGKRPKARALNE